MLSCEATVMAFASRGTGGEREECAIVHGGESPEWRVKVSSELQKEGWNGDGLDGTCQSQKQSV